ncbi:Acg family FMN-binding oxidoreductase [Kitasatospora sp. NPDC096147]|uniref:Acg family FMN-binding oxidoreductase n=1 Tax=Kitasatospora sp. NPDC096147 TaxID=3364093 RepID=UPI003804C802
MTTWTTDLSGAGTPLTEEQVRLLVTAAGAAPSVHNSQPWAFAPTADRTGLLVRIDRSRAVPVTDPDGRALHVSVGAALFDLRVAAERLLGKPESILLPDPADPDLAALLRMPTAGTAGKGEQGGVAGECGGLGGLYGAIGRRHSSREPFADRDVPEAVLGELIEAAGREGVRLTVPEEDGVRRVLRLTAEAESRTAADLSRQAETRSWLRAERSAVDGIPAEALGPLDHEARVPVRNFAGSPPRSVPTRRFEALPQLLLFGTGTDGPADWLRTGQALQRVWLLLTTHGLRASVLHQAVEWPDTRRQLRDPAEGPGHVQLVLRIGYGPPGRPSPRRPVAEVTAPPCRAGAGAA